MAVKGDGGGIQHELGAIGAGLPANTNSMCIAVHGRIDSDLNRLAGIACLVKYSGTPTGHMMVVDNDGTSLKLLSNYFDNDPTDAVASLAVGTAYTMFIEGDGTDLTLSLIVEGSTTILSEATTQDPFVPERLYLFGTNSSGSNESADATARWVRIWDTTLSDTEKRAEHIATSPQKSGSITNRPFTGGNLGTALSAGSGASFQVGAGGITYVEWEEAPPPVVVTISGSADVDLQTGEPDPDPDPPVITTTTLPSGQVGVQYSAQLAATGPGPLSWDVNGLPAGLSADQGGQITGTPAGTGGIGGSYTISVTVTGPGGSDTESLSLTIADAGIAPPVITSTTLPDGRVGVAYSFTFSAAGAGPYSWDIVSIPGGLVRSGPTISGLPNTPGSYILWVIVSGPGGQSAQQPFELTIRPSRARRRIASPWAATIRRGR